jgi:hypothetical protein
MGGKSKVASWVWERLGNVPNYVEPFFGSGAVLLGRPQPITGIETANDLDGFIVNFWRAVKHDPEKVVYWADQPVWENELHSRHAYLVGIRKDFTARLEGDPEYYDAKVAGWWVWGLCCWIGGGWCSGQGPWKSIDGKLTMEGAGEGVVRSRIQIGHDRGMLGAGVNRKRPHMGSPSITGKFHDVDGLYSYMDDLCERFRSVRVCCGDWIRVLGPVPTTTLGLTGVFLDPPYNMAGRSGNLYAEEMPTADAVREWAIAHGDNPKMRIALCGYSGEHEMPDSWDEVPWKTSGGYANQGDARGRQNAKRERIWFSPHCLQENFFAVHEETELYADEDSECDEDAE